MADSPTLRDQTPRDNPRRTPMSETFSKVEVITGVARRRRFPTEQKVAVVAETMQAGMSISPVRRTCSPRNMAPSTTRRSPLDEGSGSATRVLRLPRRALGPSADIESNRERVRDGAASNCEDKGSPVDQDCQAHGLQTGQCRCENVATIEGRKSVAQSRPRRQIPKRHRGHQNAGSPRRLTNLITQSPA